MESSADFDIQVASEQSTNDAEAALEALRAAITDDYRTHDNASLADVEAAASATSATPAAASSTAPAAASASQGLTSGQHSSIEKALAALNQLSSSNQTILDSMNIPGMIQGLAGSLQLLVKSNKRQTEIVKNLHAQLTGLSSSPPIDPSLTGSHVSRADYDALKKRYDALVASASTGSSRKPRQTRAATTAVAVAEVVDPPRHKSATPTDDKGLRKRRSTKLEHLVHKLANRRLGVEYNVTNFESPGTSTLPSPDSIAPFPEQSVTGIQEYRPDFRADVSHPSVSEYIQRVIDDCIEAWGSVFGTDEPTADRKKILEAVQVYWIRLCKRWQEQQARERGEVHKDELTRRKQNQYRRQQSLLARRTVAFDASPLNVCKLRALYRTLLVIDFAAPTNERPDPKRAYTPEEWTAYQRSANGGRAPDAHETVDQFWFSPAVRSLLNILDASASDQNARMKRKGRPKQAAPVFHLPEGLWDRSTLPSLRPKDANGIPITGATGVVLFRFHVDEEVQKAHPEWASGLYDNPPIPEDDQHLPGLPEVMDSSAYAHLRPAIKAARDALDVPRLSPEEVAEINSRPVAPATSVPPLLETESLDVGPDYVTRGLDSLFHITNGAFTVNGSGLIVPASDLASGAGPSMGSSVRARRQAKRSANEAPGGAATPVAKRVKGNAAAIASEIVDKGVEQDIRGDSSFLETL